MIELTKIRSFFLKNWFPKLICLLIALGLWSWVVVQQSAEQEFQVPVEFQEVPGNYMVSPESDDQVTVALRGQRTSLGAIDRADLKVEVNLSGIQEREKHVQILPWHVQHPPGLEVVDIQPRSIRVLLEMKIDKVVAVEPDFRGEKDEDLNYSIEVDPDTALVAGVRSELQDLETIFLSEIQLPGLENSPLQTEISARLPGSMDLVEPSENIFSLRVEVSEPEKERVIADVPVRIQNIPEGRSGVVDPGSVDIKVRGPQNTVEDLDAEDITAFVNAPEDDGPEIKVIRFDLPSRVRQVEDADVTRTAKVRLVD